MSGFPAAVVILNAGINTSGHAAVTSGSVSSGSVVTPNARFDVEVTIAVAATTTGTVLVTYGPSTGTENNLGGVAAATNLVALSSSYITFPVPAGWKYVVTLTGATVSATQSTHRF